MVVVGFIYKGVRIGEIFLGNKQMAVSWKWVGLEILREKENSQ